MLRFCQMFAKIYNYQGSLTVLPWSMISPAIFVHVAGHRRVQTGGGAKAMGKIRARSKAQAARLTHHLLGLIRRRQNRTTMKGIRIGSGIRAGPGEGGMVCRAAHLICFDEVVGTDVQWRGPSGLVRRVLRLFVSRLLLGLLSTFGVHNCG
jgi:hypothetical protein